MTKIIEQRLKEFRRIHKQKLQYEKILKENLVHINIGDY